MGPSRHESRTSLGLPLSPSSRWASPLVVPLPTRSPRRARARRRARWTSALPAPSRTAPSNRARTTRTAPSKCSPRRRRLRRLRPLRSPPDVFTWTSNEMYAMSVEGFVQISIMSDGYWKMNGRAHESGGWGGELSSLRRSERQGPAWGRTLTFAHDGHVAGTFVFGSRDDSFEDSGWTRRSETISTRSGTAGQPSPSCLDEPLGHGRIDVRRSRPRRVGRSDLHPRRRRPG